jgi:hypothetical protein
MRTQVRAASGTTDFVVVRKVHNCPTVIRTKIEHRVLDSNSDSAFHSCDQRFFARQIIAKAAAPVRDQTCQSSGKP